MNPMSNIIPWDEYLEFIVLQTVKTLMDEPMALSTPQNESLGMIPLQKVKNYKRLT